jgi:glycosyltransferase involved in cell wall biosynthesis
VRALGVPEGRIHVAPNAVDASIFAVSRRPHEGCVFLYVGRLDREKGVDVLLDAFRDVPGELRIVGTGTEEARLHAAAGARVSFLGALDRDELPDVYAGADVLVLPSRSEPWGMVLNEAAAAGLALVATDAVGAAFDLIEDGANGFRVAAGDAGALRRALATLAGDAPLRARFSSRSRELARAFTPGAWADAVTDAARRVS